MKLTQEKIDSRIFKKQLKDLYTYELQEMVFDLNLDYEIRKTMINLICKEMDIVDKRNFLADNIGYQELEKMRKKER